MFGRGIRKVGRFLTRDDDHDSSVDISEKDGVRALHLGSVTVQSAMRVAAPYQLELTYSRGMMMFLLFSDKVRDVLIVGLGGGSIPKFIYHYLPPLRVTAVELNPAVVVAARSAFLLPPDDERLRVVLGDGVVHVKQTTGSADVLMVDAFDSKGVAPGLSSQEFYDNCANALTTDGILVVNLWGSDKNFDIYLQRIEHSFDGRVLVLPTGRPGNILVFAFARHPGDLRWKSLRERARTLQAQHPIEFLEFVERLREHNDNTANRLIL
jgi:spermidine synthase